MSLTDDLKELAALHAAGSLTEAEFASAKAAAIERAQSPPPPASDPKVLRELESLRRESRLLKIDQEWHVEREQYLVHNKGGPATEPELTTGIFVGVILFVAGVAFLCMGAFALPDKMPFMVIIGLFCILLSIGVPYYHYQRYTAYQDALAGYHERRRAAARVK